MNKKTKNLNIRKDRIFIALSRTMSYRRFMSKKY